MRILNFGSLNIDYVYRVGQIARPGQTINGRSFEVFAGGKGANQSVALAKANAHVVHAGRIGPEGRWLLEKLRDFGVDTSHVRIDDNSRTGHAIIQIDDCGENAIVLFPGANHRIDRLQIDTTLNHFGREDVLLLQNEINEIPYLIEAGRARGMTICFNPAPFDNAVHAYPLDQVHVLVLNQTEGQDLSGCRSADRTLGTLAVRYPSAEIVLTLGDRGVHYRARHKHVEIKAIEVKAVDTTAAGDTFIGYLWACRASNQPIQQALETACRAAALCVTKPGAMDAIPIRHEVSQLR